MQQQAPANERCVHVLQPGQADGADIGLWTSFRLKLDIQQVLIRVKDCDRHRNLGQRIAVVLKSGQQTALSRKDLGSHRRLPGLEIQVSGYIWRNLTRNGDPAQAKARTEVE